MIIPEDAALGRARPQHAPLTPISDKIREELLDHINTQGPLPVWCSENVKPNQGLEPSGRNTSFFLLQDTGKLPPFTESELDDPQLLASAAAEIYRMRRARDKHMCKDLLGEPGWDILLALYAEEPTKLTVSSVCYGSGVPHTTALRWVGVLGKQGFIERTQHPKDSRVILLSLTDQGRLILERSLKSMLRAARG